MQSSPHSESPCLARTGKRSFHPMTDVPHQWVFDHLSALCLLGEMDKEEVERIHALFVQRFPDEVADMKARILAYERIMTGLTGLSFADEGTGWDSGLDLEQQGDNYITESANEEQ